MQNMRKAKSSHTFLMSVKQSKTGKFRSKGQAKPERRKFKNINFGKKRTQEKKSEGRSSSS